MVNREIKLRPYNQHTGEMYEPMTIEQISRIRNPANISPVSVDLIMYFDSIIWSPFTRLRDRNYKEIYEDDVIVWFSPLGEREKMLVYYRNGAVYFKRFETEKQYDWAGVDTTEIEVIGNIHEQPELLN